MTDGAIETACADWTSDGIWLMYGDCLERMREIPDGSVDMVLCDLPYGMTICRWDTVIPFEPLWEQYRRICKTNAAICLFGMEPFSTELRHSNLKMFRYDWIWEKPMGTGFFNANKMPLKNYEIISVFYRKLPTYNPQKTKGKPYIQKQGQIDKVYGCPNTGTVTKSNGERYPKAILKMNNATGLHSTQKPVALCEYMIKTYTNPGETVLDNCMGSGTTGVACINTGRKFIGIELGERYFGIAKERIENTQQPKEAVQP